MPRSILGVRLILKLGTGSLRPAPYEVSSALTRVEVTDNADERDGFQMTFTLSKAKARDYNLLQSGIFDPSTHVMIGVFLSGNTEVLMDGVITHHQFEPSNEPGTFTLTVTGEDISLMLDLKEKNNSYANMSDSQIVEQLLDQYAHLGFDTYVQTTNDTAHENQRITRQSSTDLKFLQSLAKRNGFVFYIDPEEVGSTTVFWGEEDRKKVPQPALNMNMGPDTNVTSLSFTNNALTPVNATGSYIDPENKQVNAVSSSPSGERPLASSSTKVMRTVLLRNTGQRTSSQAALAASAITSDNSKSVTGNGQLDSVIYGYILHAGQLVNVRGTGASYNGTYYVRQVKHTIERGTYTQNFTLSREGVGALKSKVRPL